MTGLLSKEGLTEMGARFGAAYMFQWPGVKAAWADEGGLGLGYEFGVQFG